jgi:competence protein ComEA
VPDLSRSELAAYAACAVLVALLGWRALRAEHGVGESVASAAPGQARSAQTAGVSVRDAASGVALVHVVGAVRHPGVYRLRVGQRVQEAIRRAGGTRPGADLQAINLAAKIADAQQIVVPRRAAGASGTAPAAAGPAAEAGGSAGTPINLNTATAEQLDTLDGVGPATAQKILEYRQQHGGFRAVDDLAQIPGIGPKRLEALRARVQV